MCLESGFSMLNTYISRLLINHQREQDDDISAEQQYYLVMLPANMQSLERILKQIFRLCWKHSIIHVNVLIEGRNGVITLYTYYPFTEKSCIDQTPTVHNRLVNGSFEFNKPIFPTKTSNLWQCPLRMIVSEIPPYVTLNNEQFSGLDANIAIDLSKLINFSLEIVVSPDGDGQIYSNVNSTGMYALVSPHVFKR